MMLKRIFAFLFMGMLLLAVFLKLNGVDHIEFDDTYYRFMQAVLQRNSAFTMEIPEIPLIPLAQNVGAWWDILRVLVTFANGIVRFINLIILVLNVVISVLQFVLSIIIEIMNQLKIIIQA